MTTNADLPHILMGREVGKLGGLAGTSEAVGQAGAGEIPPLP